MSENRKSVLNMSPLHKNSRIFCKFHAIIHDNNHMFRLSQRIAMEKANRKHPQLERIINDIHKANKKIEHKHYKKAVKQNQLKKISTFRGTIDSISSYLCEMHSWFATDHPSDPPPPMLAPHNTHDITQLFGIYPFLPDNIYKYWLEKPEVDDPIYGLDPDCESPYLYVSSTQMLQFYKLWGYFREREIRHRCAMFSYMKAQRRCARPQFWEIFDLTDTFLVELQILAVHLWIIKTRMHLFQSPISNELSYETFRIMFNELGVRFEKHISGSEIRWESDCQHACLYLAAALDEVWDNYQLNSNHYNPYIFAKVIWSEIYLLNQNVSLDVLYLWSKYIFDEMNELRKVSDFNFLNGWWKFGELPSIQDREMTAKEIIEFMEGNDHNRQKTFDTTNEQQIDQVFDDETLAELAHSQMQN
eukprot:62327_1